LAFALLALPSSAAARGDDTVLTALRPYLRHIPNVCVRLPDRGPEAILVVQRTAFVRRARRALHAAHVDGRVEVRPGPQYTNEIIVLGREIELHAPAFPHTVHAAYGIEGVREECVRALLQLARRDEATEAEVAWAKAEVARYGSDRVGYIYTAVAEALYVNAKPRPQRWRLGSRGPSLVVAGQVHLQIVAPALQEQPGARHRKAEPSDARRAYSWPRQ
jgi:hypothetical protein